MGCSKTILKNFIICFDFNLIQIRAKTNFYKSMSNEKWGMFDSMDHALEMIRESGGIRDGYALIADATDAR